MARYILLFIVRICLGLSDISVNHVFVRESPGSITQKIYTNGSNIHEEVPKFALDENKRTTTYRSKLPAVIKQYKLHLQTWNMETVNITHECKTSLKTFLANISRNELGAMKMLDATAKIPSGLLSGNVNQYGDFDECVSVTNAQYCLAELDVRQLWQEPYSKFKDLVHSHFTIQEEFDDPKHRVPGFTMIRWGFCLPNDCNANDLKILLEANLDVKANIPRDMCQTLNKSENHRTVGHFVTRLFFVGIILALTLSTVIDHYGSNEIEKKYQLVKILLCFSLYRNWKNLLDVDENKNNKEIQAVHGIRALSALALLMSHKMMSLFYNPFINRTAMSESCGEPWSVIGRTAIIYTDSFLFLSGLLNANALLGDLLRGRGLRFKDKLVNRVFRIIPSLLAVILFCTYLLPDLGIGPLWPLVVKHHSKLCKKYMWRNLLFVHNLFGFENMCLTHTHQVGIDMQLFLVTGVLITILWKNKKVGTWIIGTIAVLSTFLRLWVSWSRNLSHMVHFGIPISRMFATADYSYILPTHRATIYLMGVYMAFFLKTSKSKQFSRLQGAFLWCFAVVIGFSTLIGPYHMARRGYVFQRIDGTLYGAISPILWGIGLAWTIYTSNHNFSGRFGEFLSWRGFRLFSKIAYAVYLVQFPVFFYSVGVTRHSDEFKLQMMLQLPETLTIILISLGLTLAVEMPFQNLKRVLLEDEKSRAGDRQVNKRKSKLG